jgi:hypothetical protein
MPPLGGVEIITIDGPGSHVGPIHQQKRPVHEARIEHCALSIEHFREHCALSIEHFPKHCALGIEHFPAEAAA